MSEREPQSIAVHEPGTRATLRQGDTLCMSATFTTDDSGRPVTRNLSADAWVVGPDGAVEYYPASIDVRS